MRRYSIVRGTQLKDNVVKLRECGVKEVHMRIACPPLVYPCVFLNFSSSRSNFDLFTRRVIRDLEGTSDLTEEILKPYTDPDSEKYKKMLEVMAQHLQLEIPTSGRYRESDRVTERRSLYALLG